MKYENVDKASPCQYCTIYHNEKCMLYEKGLTKTCISHNYSYFKDKRSDKEKIKEKLFPIIDEMKKDKFDCCRSTLEEVKIKFERMI